MLSAVHENKAKQTNPDNIEKIKYCNEKCSVVNKYTPFCGQIQINFTIFQSAPPDCSALAEANRSCCSRYYCQWSHKTSGSLNMLNLNVMSLCSRDYNMSLIMPGREFTL